MQILIKGIADPDETGLRLTPVYQWCKTQTEAIKLIRDILRKGINTVILKRVEDEAYEYLNQGGGKWDVIKT